MSESGSESSRGTTTITDLCGVIVSLLEGSILYMLISKVTCICISCTEHTGQYRR